MQFTQPRVWDRRTKKTTHLQSARITNSARISHFRYALLIFSFILVPNLLAAPSGGQIVGGVGSIHQSGLTTTIQQQTGAIAIDWNTFNVNVDERVQFQQPDVSSIALNRILDQLPSQINGRLDANGRIVLVNPNGLFFGNNASINVGGLIASGLDIDPMDFMNGDYQFQALENSAGTVFNAGLIQASLGGSVALLGKQVENQGMISADLGIVALAAGKQAVLTFDHSGLLGLRITEAVLQDELGIDPAVLNSGDISAAGGKVLMTASVSQDVFSEAVNTGELQAARSVVVNADGSVTLGAGADLVNTGTVNVSSESSTSTGQIVMLGANITQRGVIRADQQTTTDTTNPTAGQIELHAQDTLLLTDNSLTSASADTGRGGEITLLGNQIGLFDQARLALNGDSGGGSLLFGGDLRGENPDIPNASAVYISEATSIQADAIRDGDGGRIIIYATDSAKVFGNISATGGALGGDGGFLETSAGVVNLDFAVDVGAANGTNGQWLIDPFNLSICSGDDCNDDATQNGNKFIADLMDSELDVQTLLAALVTGDVTVETGVGGMDEPNGGNITLDTELDYNGSKSSTLTLNAHHDIVINHSIIDSDTDSNDTLNLVFNADNNLMNGGDVVINDGVMIDTNDGSFTASGEGFNLANGSSIDTGTGDFKITTDGLVDADGKLVVGGDADINAGDGSIRLLNIGNLFTGEMSLNSRGNVTLVNNADFTLAKSSIDKDLIISTLSGDITQTGALEVGGTALFSAPDGSSITLDNKNNKLQGSVSFVTTDDDHLNNVVFTNNPTINLSVLDIIDNLTIKSVTGDITQNDALIVVELAKFTALAGLIDLSDLNNEFLGTVSLNSEGNASLVNSVALTLAESSIDGDLTIKADGNITQTGALEVDGKSVFSLPNGSSITLDNKRNKLQDSVSFITSDDGQLNNVAFTNIRDIILGELDITGDLTLSSTTGDVKQTAAWHIDGLADIAGTRNLLNNAQNDFSSLKLTGNNATVINNSALTLAGANLFGTLDLSLTNGSITQLTDDPSEALLIGITATFTVQDSESITLNNKSNNIAEVILNGKLASLEFTNTAGITLDELDLSGDLILNSTKDDIRQTDAWIVTGLANLTAATDIMLQNTQNDFASLKLSGVNATVTNNSALELAGADLSGDLTLLLNSGSITQLTDDPSEALLIDGMATFTVQNGESITLNNKFNNIAKEVIFNGELASLKLTNTADIKLGNNLITNDLEIISNGNINASNRVLIVDGNTTITTDDGSILLSNEGNSFVGTVSLQNTGNNAIELVNSSDLKLGNIALERGALTITTDGDITQSGAIVQTGENPGDVTITAKEGPIDLGNSDNDFKGTLFLDAFKATVRDKNSLTLGDSFIERDLTIISNGNINTAKKEVLIVGNKTSINAGDGFITLTNKNNVFAGEVSLQNTGNNAIELVNSSDLKLGNIALEGGALTITADGDITQSGAIVQTGENPGNVTINAFKGFEGFAGSIDLSNPNNQFLGAVSLNSESNASLENSVALTLAESSIAGDLTIKAITGNIAQTDKLKVVGSASFNVADGESIMLNDARNNIRNVSFTPVLKNLEFASKHAITLGALNITGDLTLNSTRRSIGQTGAWVVAGLAKLNAGDNIIMDNSENSFRHIEFTANKITLVHQNWEILKKDKTNGKKLVLSLKPVPRPKKDNLETK